MAWEFKVLQISAASKEFHDAIKKDIDMTIEGGGTIRHKSDREIQLAAQKGKYYGDFFQCTVTLGDGKAAHDHFFTIIRGPEIFGKRLYAGRIGDDLTPGVVGPFTHNGTWHGIGN